MVSPIGGPTSNPVTAGSEENALTVKVGDTLSSIALRNQVSLKELLAANPQISDPNQIAAGQLIHLPSRSQANEALDATDGKIQESLSPPDTRSVQNLDKAMVLLKLQQSGTLQAKNTVVSQTGGMPAKVDGSSKADVRGNYSFREYDKGGNSYKEAKGRLGMPGEVEEFRSGTSQKATAGGTGDDAGHLIGNRFGAPGGPENLSAQNWKANRFGTYKDLEDSWAAKRKQGIEIDVQVTDVSKAGGDRPFRRNVQWTETAPNGSKTTNSLDFANTQTPESRALRGTPATTDGSEGDVIHVDFKNRRRLDEQPAPSGKDVKPTPSEDTGIEGPGGAKGAVEGAGMIIQEGINHALNQQELAKADAQYERFRPEVERLNRQGEWVAVVATVDVPKIPDFFGDIAGYHEARDLPRFKFLTLQHGATREEALNPAPKGPTISAAPPVTVPPEPIEMPREGRKWVQAIYTISPPPLAGPSIPGLQLR